jgi:hypothetical protein
MATLFLALALLPQEEPEPLVPPETVKQTLERVLSDPAYRRLRPAPKAETKHPAWLERLLDWLLERRGPSAPASWSLPVALVELLGWAMYVVVAAAFAWVVFLIARSLAGRARRERPLSLGLAASAAAAATPPGELPSEEYLRAAVALAHSGRHREAIRQLLLGAMSFIERNGHIRYRKGLTNRDYLRAVWRRPKLRDSLEPIVLAFDQVYFGRRPATAERFAECLKHFRAGFQTA